MKLKHSRAVLVGAAVVLFSIPSAAFATEINASYLLGVSGFMPDDVVIVATALLLMAAVTVSIVASVRLREARKLACDKRTCPNRESTECRLAAASSAAEAKGEHSATTPPHEAERRILQRRKIDKASFSTEAKAIDDDPDFFSSIKTPEEFLSHSDLHESSIAATHLRIALSAQSADGQAAVPAAPIPAVPMPAAPIQAVPMPAAPIQAVPMPAATTPAIAATAAPTPAPAAPIPPASTTSGRSMDLTWA